MTPNSAHTVSPAVPSHRAAGGEEGGKGGEEGGRGGEEGRRGGEEGQKGGKEEGRVGEEREREGEEGGRGSSSVAGQRTRAGPIAMETRRVSPHKSSEIEEDEEEEVTMATPHPVSGEL